MHTVGAAEHDLHVATIHWDVAVMLRPAAIVDTGAQCHLELEWADEDVTQQQGAPSPNPSAQEEVGEPTSTQTDEDEEVLIIDLATSPALISVTDPEGTLAVADRSPPASMWDPPPVGQWDAPRLDLSLRTCRSFAAAKSVWTTTFEEHHYLSASLVSSSISDVLRLSSGEPVGFIATAPAYGTPSEAGKAPCESRPVRREHRVVVLPAWQGLGLGPRLSNLVASTWIATPNASHEGMTHRYFCKTAHPRFGAYREADRDWVASSSNNPPRAGAEGSNSGRFYSHEFVGAPFSFVPGEGRLRPVVKNQQQKIETERKIAGARKAKQVALQSNKRGRTI